MAFLPGTASRHTPQSPSGIVLFRLKCMDRLRFASDGVFRDSRLDACVSFTLSLPNPSTPANSARFPLKTNFLKHSEKLVEREEHR